MFLLNLVLATNATNDDVVAVLVFDVAGIW